MTVGKGELFGSLVNCSQLVLGQNTFPMTFRRGFALTLKGMAVYQLIPQTPVEEVDRGIKCVVLSDRLIRKGMEPF